MNYLGSKIGELLVQKNFASIDQVEQGLTQSRTNGKKLGQNLVSSGAISYEQLAEVLALQSGLPYVDLNSVVPLRKSFEHVSPEMAMQLSVFPYMDEEGNYTVAVSDPFDISLQHRLENIAGNTLSFSVASSSGIRNALNNDDGASDVLLEVSEVLKSVSGNEETTLEVLNQEVAKDKGPIVKLVNMLLLAAINKSASDVHIEIYPSGIVTKYRIDGVLVDAMNLLDRSNHDSLVARLKVLAGLDVAEKRAAQDGRFKMKYEGREIDFRISVVPASYGEDVVIRILDKLPINERGSELSLESLQLFESACARLRKGIDSPYGMVLLTGPTGSGKSTTLYAALNELNTGQRKIITIEDPVEYQLDGVVQMPLNERKNVTFSSGLRSILRHDPDVIMVGEIRDADTAHIAVQSALTGHLLLSTLHANSSVDVFSRVQHFGIDPYDMVSALNCVVAQRLIRLCCEYCKKPIQYDEEYLRASEVDVADTKTHSLYKGAGCSKCNATGYSGRKAVAEVLLLSDSLREMILNREPVSRLRECAMAEGMVPLRAAVLEQAMQGVTTLEEVNRVTSVVV